jgi:hypothetical protein
MRLLTGLHLFALALSSVQAQVRDVNGNLLIYSNYDGGALTINVDLNIPGLRIGVCTYKAVAVNITGPFAGNVV